MESFEGKKNHVYSGLQINFSKKQPHSVHKPYYLVFLYCEGPFICTLQVTLTSDVVPPLLILT
jgi:hypothetical protein